MAIGDFDWSIVSQMLEAKGTKLMRRLRPPSWIAQPSRPRARNLALIVVVVTALVALHGENGESSQVFTSLQAPGHGREFLSLHAPGRQLGVGRNAMIEIPADVKKGLKLLVDNTPLRILSFESRNAGGKGKWTVVARVQNLVSGVISDKTFQGGSKYEEVVTKLQETTYSYEGADKSYVFMNTETFEEMTVSQEVLGEGADFLTEGVVVDVEMWDGKPLGVRFKEDIVIKVESVPQFSGGSSNVKQTGDQKVFLSNGVAKLGPQYLKAGDMVIVDRNSFQIAKRA